MVRLLPKGPQAFVLIASIAFAWSIAAAAKVGTNAFATPYVISAGGTSGTISAPPATGTSSTASSVLTTIGGSLETGEPTVSAVNLAGAAQPVQGQTVWFSWTPGQNTKAVITVTSANTNPYQFQPAIAVYASPTSLATARPAAGAYVVSPNIAIGAASPSTGGGYIELLYPGIYQTVAVINAVAGTTYMIQVDGLQNSGFPYTSQGNFTFSLAPVGGSENAPAPTYFPQTGWWYSPGVPGVGFAFEVNPPLALLSPGGFFLGAFMYDDSGLARWYTAQGQLAQTSVGLPAQPASAAGVFPPSPAIAANSYYSVPTNPTAPIFLQEFANGPTLTQTTGSGVTLAGNRSAIQVIFNSATTGFIVLNGVSVPIQRYPIPGAVPFLPSNGTTTTGTTSTTSALNTPVMANGWYWNSAQPGSGVFFEQQASQVFVADFMYRDGTGTSVWYAANGALSSTSLFNALMYEYRGGASLNFLRTSPMPAVPPQVGTIANRGSFLLTLNSSATSSSGTTTGSSVGTATVGSRSLSLSKYNF